jgi:eukaryotic-like serine/threonine-protein kinase
MPPEERATGKGAEATDARSSGSRAIPRYEDSPPSSGHLEDASERYRVFATLGSGGMADVRLGTVRGPVGFNKLVVIKRLRSNLAEDPAMVSMFLDEARLAARLNHPNVVHTYEVGKMAEAYFIAMEYLEGQSLHALRHAVGDHQTVVRPAIWARIIADALAGLHYAHELKDFDGTALGIVHRDISPQNIFVTYDGRVKLVDFGIAKAVLNTTTTETGVLKGKVAYMAPEQALGDKIDRRADIFAMGAVLWEVLAKKKMISGDAAQALNALLNKPIPRVSEVFPDVPPALDEIVMRALHRSPEERFQTALQMKQLLEKFIASIDDPPTEEEIGAIVQQLFAERRELVRRQIQAHIADPITNSETELPLISSGSRRKLDPNSTGSITAQVPMDLDESSKSVSRAMPAQAPSRLGPRVTLVLAFIAAVAGATIILTRTIGRHDAPSAPAPIAPAAATTAMAAHLTVRVYPNSARLYLDGASVVGNPWAGDVTKAVHIVRAEADGYSPVQREIRLDGDQSLDLSLTPLPTPTTTAAPPATTTTASPPPKYIGKPVATQKPTAAPTATPTGPAPTSTKPRPNLDDNPWGN